MGSVDDFMEAEMKHKLEEESKIIGGLATLEKNGGMTINCMDLIRNMNIGKGGSRMNLSDGLRTF